MALSNSPPLSSEGFGNPPVIESDVLQDIWGGDTIPNAPEPESKLDESEPNRGLESIPSSGPRKPRADTLHQGVSLESLASSAEISEPSIIVPDKTNSGTDKTGGTGGPESPIQTLLCIPYAAGILEITSTKLQSADKIHFLGKSWQNGRRTEFLLRLGLKLWLPADQVPEGVLPRRPGELDNSR
ncbi:uncharacterized protein ATNIH1004_006643 [Aspergillus tanneri]|uniref:Uncharacterized protein n=1 Tax=Aspergillus tanneri TaxID=1220188 RepID=A0A5M9MIM3_9EURO|nr:uncharacterized protein ATNIH1004_006643 [Aspergillus tanneri]KAA8645224.1 hypothetical protein ATNIH1004_006643 [Aspergillus tanneri]